MHGVVEMDRYLLCWEDDLARPRRVAGGPGRKHPRGSRYRGTGVRAGAASRNHGCRTRERHAGNQPHDLASDRLHRFTNNCNEARTR